VDSKSGYLFLVKNSKLDLGKGRISAIINNIAGVLNNIIFNGESADSGFSIAMNSIKTIKLQKTETPFS
jgi:hypothetical protein